MGEKEKEKEKAGLDVLKGMLIDSLEPINTRLSNIEKRLQPKEELEEIEHEEGGLFDGIL